MLDHLKAQWKKSSDSTTTKKKWLLQQMHFLLAGSVVLWPVFCGKPLPIFSPTHFAYFLLPLHLQLHVCKEIKIFGQIVAYIVLYCVLFLITQSLGEGSGFSYTPYVPVSHRIGLIPSKCYMLAIKLSSSLSLKY
ncbi:hypothetical protein Q8A67_007165 [Cirrhinus molitorella]|uniref:Uncharacterized protein n=1 Tax=Cirrhinus molitorella TaxID=172907 RepID=A0AA88TTJ3_9TELE|nr:hypothetical protein Q8A67_007165 [Cirrhinus molitorella]